MIIKITNKMSKNKDEFRNYNQFNSKVIETYKLNHQNQTYEYVIKMKEEYCTKFDKVKMSIWDVIELANEIVDESDPDFHLQQIHHSFQTAEKLRTLFPNDKELHLVGFIHDLGKVLLLTQFGCLPQWSVVGDTYPIGCKFSDKIIFNEFFENKSVTEYGIYKPNCGFDNVVFSFGHDEYLYCVLKNHPQCKLSNDSLRIIRYHSFYPFHKNNAYHHLANENDLVLKPMLKLFSQCDLYSKDDNNKMNINELTSYYSDLIDKYCPGILDW